MGVMLPQDGYAPRMPDEPIPAADANEQAQEVGDPPPPEVPRLADDVPEADALEQAQDVHEVVEDYGA
jgi:hypothetical protein